MGLQLTVYKNLLFAALLTRKPSTIIECPGAKIPATCKRMQVFQQPPYKDPVI